MQRLQGCHAFMRLALHLQQDYLLVIEERCLGFEQFDNRINLMAAIETTRPVPFGAITTYRTFIGVSGVVSHLLAWNDARVTRNSLNRLSDRELDDIGLCRGDIDLIGR